MEQVAFEHRGSGGRCGRVSEFTRARGRKVSIATREPVGGERRDPAVSCGPSQPHSLSGRRVCLRKRGVSLAGPGRERLGTPAFGGELLQGGADHGRGQLELDRDRGQRRQMSVWLGAREPNPSAYRLHVIVARHRAVRSSNACASCLRVWDVGSSWTTSYCQAGENVRRGSCNAAAHSCSVRGQAAPSSGPPVGLRDRRDARQHRASGAGPPDLRARTSSEPWATLVE